MNVREQHPARLFALVAGFVYLAIGVLGFLITGFGGFAENGPHAPLGFDLNPFHNVVHIVVGLVLIVSFLPVGRPEAKDVVVTQGILVGGGLILVAAALLGFLNIVPILSIDSNFALDNFLHLVTGGAAIAAGLLAPRASGKTVAGGEAERPPSLT